MKKTIWLVICFSFCGQVSVRASQWYHTQRVFGPNELPLGTHAIYTDMYEDVFYMGTGTFEDSETSGSARIWRYHEGQWNFEQELTPAGADENLKYGVGAVLGDDICIFHSRAYDDENVLVSYQAHVFEFDGNRWTETQVITNPEVHPVYYYSYYLALDQDVFLMPGADGVFVYRRGEGGFEFEQKLVPFDDTSSMGFGSACKVTGDTCVVTSPHDETAEGMGSIYVYRFDGTRWQPERKISGFWPMDPRHYVYWLNLALSEDRCVVGAPSPCCGEPVPGKTLIYNRWDNWRLEQVLNPYNDDYGGSGYSISLNDDLLAVNSIDSDGTGDISMYRHNGSVWQRVGRIPSEEYAPVFVTHDNGEVIVGSVLWEGGWLSQTGTVRLDAWRECPTADVTGDCFVDLADFSVLAQEWLTGLHSWPWHW